jgi:hypothetical protein
MLCLKVCRAMSIGCNKGARRTCDALLHLWSEVPQKALNRPCSRIAERADGVAFDLLGELIKLVDLAGVLSER